MPINLDNNFWSNAFANAVGTIIAAFLIKFIGQFFLNSIWQVMYRNVPIILRKLLLMILSLLNKPMFLLIVSLTFQVLIFLDIHRTFAILITTIIILIFYNHTKPKLLLIPSLIPPKLSDEFQKLGDIEKNWETITGEPTLDEGKGNPRPSLYLTKVDPQQATNTFLVLKEITAERGEIECDFFLEHGALLNIVFMCDKMNRNWHMARYDSRGGTSDGLLIKDSGKGNNWRFNNMSTARTNSGSWYRAKVEFSSERARMFRNGELIAEITNPQMFGKYIGLFNECANVSVDNFKFSEG